MQPNKIGINGDDLIFNVAQLLKEQVGATREYDVDQDHCDFTMETVEGEPAEILAADHLRGHFKFTRLNEGILVGGEVEVEVTQECARCLEDSQIHLSFTLAEEFRPTIDVHSGTHTSRVEEEEAAEDNTEFFLIDGNHTLNLEEAIRQDILVALPMQPLCRPDCAGICPICGQNRNNVQCDCDDEVVDPRFAVLQNLLPAE